MNSQHIYELRLHMDRRTFDLISDPLLFGQLWYGDPVYNSLAFVLPCFSDRCNVRATFLPYLLLLLSSRY